MASWERAWCLFFIQFIEPTRRPLFATDKDNNIREIKRYIKFLAKLVKHDAKDFVKHAEQSRARGTDRKKSLDQTRPDWNIKLTREKSAFFLASFLSDVWSDQKRAGRLAESFFLRRWPRIDVHFRDDYCGYRNLKYRICRRTLCH